MTVDERRQPLFALQRRERIMDELRQGGAISVREIAVTLGVSELTVRRDVNALAQQGLVTRVHGGATLRSSIEPGVGSRDATVTKYAIGMVVPSLDYYWPQVVSGARAQATQLQARLSLRGSLYDARDNRKQVKALMATPGIHGIIVAPQTDGEAGLDMLRWLDTLPLPVVLAERRGWSASAGFRLDTVGTDHAAGAALAVRHLHELGHERIGLLAEPESPTTSPVRRGWAKAVEDFGLAADVVNTDAASFESHDREAVMDEILEQCRATGTTALLILSDPQAVAFEQHCIDRGIRIPGDLSLVAYDDEVARFGDPAITAVRPPKQYVGRTAVDLLLARLEGGRSRPAHRITLSPELVLRDSTGPRQAAG